MKDVHEFIRRYFDGESSIKDKPEEYMEEGCMDDGVASKDENEPMEDV